MSGLVDRARDELRETIRGASAWAAPLSPRALIDEPEGRATDAVSETPTAPETAEVTQETAEATISVAARDIQETTTDPEQDLSMPDMPVAETPAEPVVADAPTAVTETPAPAPSRDHVDGTDLAALLCARLCHDLVSPISAIGAALDVIEDPSAEDMHAQALELIRKSAEQGWAKLEFTRLAFGAGGSAPGRIEAEELRRVTEGVFNTEKCAVEWDVEAVDMEKGVARMLLNLCLLGAEALPRGGTVSVSSDVDGTHYRIESAGRRARLAPDVETALSGKAPEDGYDARSIQPYYTGQLAVRAGGLARAYMEGENVVFEAFFGEKAKAAA